MRGRGSKVAGTGAVALLVASWIGTAVHASDDAPPFGAAAVPVDVATTTVTLPLFGAPLTIGITTGADGALHNVDIDVADGFTATRVKPHRVAFVNEDGTAKVVIKSREGGQRVEAKAGSLTEISGPGSWAGEVFPGKSASVSFVIGAASDGGPDIAQVVVDESLLGGAVVTISPTVYSSGDDDDDEQDERSARAKVQFTDGTQTRWLVITAALHTDDEGNTRAKLQIALSRIKAAAAPAETVVGPQHWEGALCDGTQAAIDFVVAADGSVSGVVVVPDSARVESGEHGIGVRFATGERVRIKVQDHDGMRRIKVETKIRCERVEPTVNSSTTSPGDDGEGDGEGDGDGRRGRDRGRDKNHGSTTTSTTATEPTTAPTTTAESEPDDSGPATTADG